MDDTLYQVEGEIDSLRKDLIWQLGFLKNPESFNIDILKKSVEDLEILLQTLRDLG